jgi:hypothetical protein
MSGFLLRYPRSPDLETQKEVAMSSLNAIDTITLFVDCITDEARSIGAPSKTPYGANHISERI